MIQSVAFATIDDFCQTLAQVGVGCSIWGEENGAPAQCCSKLTSRWVDQQSLCHVYKVCRNPTADASPTPGVEQTAIGESVSLFPQWNNRVMFIWSYTPFPILHSLHTAKTVHFNNNNFILQVILISI